MNQIVVSMPHGTPLDTFKQGEQYHFAYNKGEFEHWSFWVLDNIKLYEDTIEFIFRLAPGWD